MKVLAFAEQRENTFKKSAFETVQAARKAADRLGAEFAALVVGSGVNAVAARTNVHALPSRPPAAPVPILMPWPPVYIPRRQLEGLATNVAG